MELKNFIRIQEDFPKKGISFKDVSPLLADAEAFKEAISQMKDIAAKWKPDVIIGPEARGFIFGAPLAQAMGVGFVMARKSGKLPGDTFKVNYSLEYGSDTLEVPSFAIRKGTRVVICDDLLATGGTLAALEKLLRSLGAEVVGILAAIELTDLGGRKNLTAPFEALVTYPH